MSADKETTPPAETRPSRTFEPRPAPAHPEPQRPAAFDPNDPNPPAPPQSRPTKDSDAGFGSFG